MFPHGPNLKILPKFCGKMKIDLSTTFFWTRHKKTLKLNFGVCQEESTKFLPLPDNFYKVYRFSRLRLFAVQEKREQGARGGFDLSNPHNLDKITKVYQGFKVLKKNFSFSFGQGLFFRSGPRSLSLNQTSFY